jgi:hypothetical protein
MKQLSHLAVRPASVLLKRLICAYALIILGPLAQSALAQATPSSTQLNFGSLYVGDAGTQSVTLTNTGATPVLFSASLAAIGGADFSRQTNCPGNAATIGSCTPLPVGGVCSYQVRYAPTAAGVGTQTLSIIVYNVNAAVASTISVCWFGPAARTKDG